MLVIAGLVAMIYNMYVARWIPTFFTYDFTTPALTKGGNMKIKLFKSYKKVVYCHNCEGRLRT